MISRFSRYTARLVTKPTRNVIYLKLHEADLTETPIPVYSSTKLHELVQAKDIKTFVDSVYSNKEAHQRYLRLVPFFLEHLIGHHKKFFVVKMGLLPNAEYAKLDCITNSGILTKYINLKNTIPVIWDDFIHWNFRITREMPTFVDPEMIYYNLVDAEFYLFDMECEWHKEGVEHPALSLKNRFNEKQWLDIYRVLSPN